MQALTPKIATPKQSTCGGAPALASKKAIDRDILYSSFLKNK
jgi:hypothetical protein